MWTKTIEELQIQQKASETNNILLTHLWILYVSGTKSERNKKCYVIILLFHRSFFENVSKPLQVC